MTLLLMMQSITGSRPTQLHELYGVSIKHSSRFMKDLRKIFFHIMYHDVRNDKLGGHKIVEIDESKYGSPKYNRGKPSKVKPR